MAKVIKQTMSDVVEKKPCIRVNADDDDKENALTAIYISKNALAKAGVKPSRVKSVDVQLTIHER